MSGLNPRERAVLDCSPSGRGNAISKRLAQAACLEGRLTRERNNGVMTRPSWPRRLSRSFDRAVTACQEWLEDPDRSAAGAAAIVTLAIFAAYIAAHLAIKICRAG